jgi:WD40 repeat protein
VAADPTVLPPYDAAVTALAFSPDGRWLATAVKADVAFLTDMGDPGRPRHRLIGHHDEVTSVAFNPHGQQLATGSRDGTIRLWDVGDRPVEVETLTADMPVTSVAFRPDGRQLAVGVESSVQLWDLGDGQPHRVHELHAGDLVASVAYSPDGQTLIASAGTSVKLWDLGVPDPATSIANPVVLRGHSDTVTAVDYSPDGRHLASASKDGTARLWLSLDALVDAGCRGVGRNLTQKEWRELLPDEGYQRTCEEWPGGP